MANYPPSSSGVLNRRQGRVSEAWSIGLLLPVSDSYFFQLQDVA